MAEPRCSYKISRRTDFDDGHSIIFVRFYPEDLTTENEQQRDGTVSPVTKYRRGKPLGEETIDFNPPAASRRLVPQNVSVAERELRIKTVLNARLLRFAPRIPISEQVNA